MARHDPTGREFKPEAYVFGDEVGRHARSPKKAWETAVLKAHGQTPRWTGNNSLTAESRIAYREIGLHFHDLRHEAGSRWLEAGMPLHHVRALLGHASISTTDTYLNAGRIDLQNSMRPARRTWKKWHTRDTGPRNRATACASAEAGGSRSVGDKLMLAATTRV